MEGEYNYSAFRAVDYFVHERPAPRPGDEVPEVPMRDLDGRIVPLSSLWAQGPAVVEFGSITCPIFVDRIEAMERLARSFGGRASFAVVYTREAHPGENYPPVGRIEDKLRHARDLRQAEGLERSVLVDDVEGRLHRWAGGFPDSVVVVGTDGRVAAYGEWNDPQGIRVVLERLLAAGGSTSELSPGVQVRHNHAPPGKLPRAVGVLRRAGWKALLDFLLQLPALVFYRLRVALRGGARGSWTP